MSNYYWSEESWGSEYPPENADEIISKANELIGEYAETHDEDETAAYSERLWEQYCMDGKVADPDIVLQISRINIKSETFCTPWHDKLYCVDICEDSEERSAWLYNANYGVKSFMFGEEVKHSREAFLDAVFSNLPDYIEDYEEEYEDE